MSTTRLFNGLTFWLLPDSFSPDVAYALRAQIELYAGTLALFNEDVSVIVVIPVLGDDRLIDSLDPAVSPLTPLFHRNDPVPGTLEGQQVVTSVWVRTCTMKNQLLDLDVGSGPMPTPTPTPTAIPPRSLGPRPKLTGDGLPNRVSGQRGVPNEESSADDAGMDETGLEGRRQRAAPGSGPRKQRGRTTVKPDHLARFALVQRWIKEYAWGTLRSFHAHCDDLLRVEHLPARAMIPRASTAFWLAYRPLLSPLVPREVQLRPERSLQSPLAGVRSGPLRTPADIHLQVRRRRIRDPGGPEGPWSATAADLVGDQGLVQSSGYSMYSFPRTCPSDPSSDEEERWQSSRG